MQDTGQSLQYLRSMAEELAAMAAKENLPVLPFIFRMAELEAGRIAMASKQTR